MTAIEDLKPAAGISDSILAGIVTISADAIVCVNESQTITFFNEGASSIFGYAPEEVLGQQLEILIPERYRSGHARQVLEFGKSSVVARRMGERGQISGLRKNGQEFPAEAAISHYGAPGSQVFTVVLRDVTERRRREETQRLLAEAGEIFSSSLGPEDTLRNVTRLVVPRLADACIVNAYRDGVFEQAAVAHVDERMGKDLERRRHEHPIDTSGNHPVARVVRSLTPFVLSATRADLQKELNSEEIWDIFEAPPSDAIITPLIARNKLLGVMSLYRSKGTYDRDDVFMAQEIGRRAALAMDNARLYELVRAGVRARDDMIGIVSHDLRNPVNAVRMLTGVMLDTNRDETLPPQVAEYAGVIRQAAQQMDALINDLLDITRVEAGRLKVNAKPSDTEELLSDTLRTLAPVASEKSIGLKLQAPDDPPAVYADSARIRQALSNLVGNAVKFSPAGSEIIVKVNPVDGEVIFSVTDSGSGMTPEQLSHAFDRFWQSSRTDRQGAGLGLAITKGIIEAHGGRIWASSKPGLGSTFYFTLPVAPGSV
jgi:PAS domain S-box-containing protein